MSPIIDSLSGLSARGYGLFGAAASTTSFESIATVTVGSGGSSSITFSSIPSTYTHLQIRCLARTNKTGDVTDYLKLRYNSDSGSNYAVHLLYGNGASVTALGFSSQSENWMQRAAGGAATTGVFGGIVVDVLDYANTSKYKTIRNLGGIDNNGSGLIYLASGLWQNTAAINTITILPGDGTSIDQYSSFALYGIKGA